MNTYNEKRKLEDNMDLGWLFGLPVGVVRIYYGNFMFLDKVYLYNVGGKITFEELYAWMRDSIYKLLDEIEYLKETIIADYEEAKRLIEKNKKLMGKYYIKEPLLGVEGGRLKVHILFENYTKDRLFGYYNRTNTVYSNGGRMLKILNKIIDEGEDGIKKYYEWLEAEKIFRDHGIEIGWFRYFKVKDNCIYLKGKDWNTTLGDLGSKLTMLCSKKEGDLCLEYNNKEEFTTLLDFLEG